MPLKSVHELERLRPSVFSRKTTKARSTYTYLNIKRHRYQTIMEVKAVFSYMADRDPDATTEVETLAETVGVETDVIVEKIRATSHESKPTDE